MSQKITSKNLSYDTSIPPFLAALRAQASGAPGPDPLLAAQRRATKKRSGSEEAEDIPLVVDENGNTIDLQVDKDGAVKEPAQQVADKDDDEKAGEDDKTGSSSKQNPEVKSAIGGRKRKVGKVIGEAAVGADQDDKTKPDSEKKEDKETADSNPNRIKTKKKAKKIKLSFDEEEG